MCLIWLYHSNQTKICQSVFWNVIHTYRTSGYQQYLHSYLLEHLLWTNQVLPIFFSEICIYQATQVEFDDSDFIFGISSKCEPRKHIDLHMWCHFESTLF